MPWITGRSPGTWFEDHLSLTRGVVYRKWRFDETQADFRISTNWQLIDSYTNEVRILWHADGRLWQADMATLGR
jgi:hypothetical protein